jgi:hypothetical protein
VLFLTVIVTIHVHVVLKSSLIMMIRRDDPWAIAAAAIFWINVSGITP